jgi:ATP-binding cassette subfamily C exporter for protease/lipase
MGKILIKFRREFWFAVAISSIANLLMVAPTIYMLQIFDRVMLSQSIFSLIVISAMIGFFYLIQGIAEWLRSKLIVTTGVQLDYALSEPVFKSIYQEQLITLRGNPSQAFSDLNVIRQWLTGSGLFAILDLPWTPIYVAIMFLLHPWLGLITILFMFLLAIFAWITTIVTRDSTNESEEEERNLNKFLHSKLQHAEVIEAHGMVNSFRNKWSIQQNEMLKVYVNSTDLNERMSSASKQLRFLMNSLSLGVGAFFVIKGELSIGAMIAASLLMSRALSPIDTIVAGWRSFVAARKSFGRIEQLLKNVRNEETFGLTLESISKIELRNFSAFSANRELRILKDISAIFPVGAIYLVLGHSGSGKSTFGRSLLGIWPHFTGEVLLDGFDISRFDRDQLGEVIGYLPQNIELFRGTVAANIARMGDVDSEKVIGAARATGTHDFILGLPHGYDALIEDRGSNLSGGQRQRVALSRAVYGFPKIVVLDEPDANLDKIGNRALRDSVAELRKRGSAVFLITHDLTMLEISDYVISMHRGNVVFYGPKEEFLFKQGRQDPDRSVALKS